MEMFKNNWWRFVGTAVVCICAIYTTWDRTHQPPPVITATKATKVNTITKVIKVAEGDGLVTEAQCHTIKKHDGTKELRKRFGFPAQTEDSDIYDNDSDTWYYPIRGDEDRHCIVRFWSGDGAEGVSLDLVAAG